MAINKTKEKLLAGQPALGSIATLGSPLSTEWLVTPGVDYVLVDDQHGIWEPESMMSAFRNIWMAGAVPMGRVGQNDFYAIGAMLDRGALGIVVPMVHTAADAEAAVFATRYPPQGGRSMGPYGCRIYGTDYLDWANDEVFLTVQIESTEGLENVEAIMAVEGIDGCWVGPGDLSASLGTAYGSEEHDAAIARIQAACVKTGKVPGIYCTSDAAHRLRQGYLFLTPSADVLHLRDGVQETIKALQDLMEQT